MNIRQLADDFYVSDQIEVKDIPALAQRGIKSVICNRPDGEAADQPDFETIRQAAEAAGLKMRNVPIVPGQAGHAEVVQTAQALHDLPKPVLAYCRSGARSTAMYDAARAAGA